MMNTNTIGEQIRHFRKIKGMTQAELANEIQRSSNLVARWERNEIQPKAENLPKIARALNVSVSDLYNEPPIPQQLEVTPEPLGLAYWGQVAENMKVLANSGNIEEINAIYSLLNIGFNALAKSKDNNSGINITQSNIGRDANIKIGKE